MEARASAKYLRGSAQKARLVVDMIRGKRVGEALAILRFTNRRAAEGIEKCLRSAIANAEKKDAGRTKGKAADSRAAKAASPKGAGAASGGEGKKAAPRKGGAKK